MTKKKGRASQIRKRLLQIPSELREDLEVLLRRRELLRGSVYHSKRRCGKPSCQCTRGKLHEATVVATTVDGKRTTRSLSGESGTKTASLAANYGEFREKRKSFRSRCKEAIALIRELEELLCVEMPGTEKKRRRRKG